MKVILLHNAEAGGGDQPSKKEILHQLEKTGFDVSYRSTIDQQSPNDLAIDADVLIVAGGDGTVRKAALKVVCTDIPLAIIPFGTANNLADTFGGFSLDPNQLQKIRHARRLQLDVGVAHSPWGDQLFVESAGIGLLAQLMSDLSPKDSKQAPSIGDSLVALRKLVETSPAQIWNVEIDGDPLPGNFLMVEAMNISSVGPNLELAPDANPGDRFFDFVLLDESKRSEFAAFLKNPAKERLSAEKIRGKAIKLEFIGPAHADDFVWPTKGKIPNRANSGSDIERKTFEIHMSENSVDLLAPPE